MKIHWKSYLDLPIEIRQGLYEKNISDEIESFRQFEKSLKGEPEEEVEEGFLELSEEQNGKITIVKNIEEGVEPEMEKRSLEELIIEFLGESDLPVEFEKAQKVLPEKAKKVLREAFAVLNRYKESMNEELREAVKVLGKYVGFGYPGIPEKYPYPSKSLEKKAPVDWISVRDMFFGKLEEPEAVEVSKSDISKDDLFPSISKQIERNKEIIDETIEENNIENGARFL